MSEKIVNDNNIEKGIPDDVSDKTPSKTTDDSASVSPVGLSASQARDAHYSRTKFNTIRKAEILAEQYKGKLVYNILLLVSAFIIGYGYGLDSSTRYIYTGYAASSYGAHSLISTIGVINAVIGAASQVVYARLSDVFGRLELLITAIVFYVVGTIIQSQAYDIQRYCAGAVFYNLGFVGVLLVVLLILSDFSSLRWRLFYQFVPTLPFIINTWIAGNVTAAVGPVDNWSWGIGMWAFIFPLASLPFICCILHMIWLANKTPEWQELKQHKSFFSEYSIYRSIFELGRRVDIIGVTLLTISIGCLLVPLTLAAGVTDQWQSGKIIGPLVLGFVLMPVFVLYESKYAVYPLAPFKLLKDRGVWSALALSILINFVFYMAYDYLYTVLVVAVNQSTLSATRITSVATFTSTVWAPAFALIVVYFRRLKGFILTGVSLWFVATGLLYHFRGGEQSKAGIIGALVVWGIGTTLFTYPVGVSVQSVTSHENMATVTALVYVLYRIGAAVGNAVSGAIWTQMLPGKIAEHLGEFNNASLANFAYSSPYSFILEYPWGTPERQAVVESYRYIQRLETVVALCLCSLLVFFAFFLRDPPLTDQQAHNDLDEDQMVYKHEDKIFSFVKRRIFRRKVGEDEFAN
jgi:SIT family siderophore-iron:H+ symporter-like MFS transporter